MPGLKAELNEVLTAMEMSFQVRLIGTFGADLICAPSDDCAATWLAGNGLKFDQFPVRNGRETIGILFRQGDYSGKTVRQAMVPLAESIIVSADMPIGHLIPQLRESHCRLVLCGGRIDGLVTQSDLLKLPVRTMIFGLISHLELCFRQLIRELFPERQWLELLSRDRYNDVTAKHRALEASRFDPDMLECTVFSDAVNILAACSKLGGDFLDKAESIRHLRNDIAHAKTFISSADDVRRFVDQFEHANQLIQRVSEFVTNKN